MDNSVIVAEASDPSGFDRLTRMISGFDAVLLLGGPALFLAFVALVFWLMVRKKRKDEALALEQDAILPPEPSLTEKGISPTPPQPLDRHIRGDQGQVQGLDQDQDLDQAKFPKTHSESELTSLKTESKSWIATLKSGMVRTRNALGSSLATLFSGSRQMDAGLLEKIHETLYRADIGVRATDRLVASIKTQFGDQSSSEWSDVQQHLIAEISAIFRSNDRPLLTPAQAPFVVLIVGVNGVGKTTTIGKLSARFMADGKSVLLGAADTFRAAAIEQLEVWGKRLNVEVIRQQQGSDPAAVAYDAGKAAVARGKDVLIIDTAGRLHNKTELMDELGKIHRVLGRDIPGAPHETWLVIDATTGQNAAAQVKAFKEVANVTGLVVTKLDGTAKGGVLIGIAEQYGIPIRYIGVGEKASDLQPFHAEEFAKSLF